ncbi:MAG TPA: ParB/RepB/Spo0J family partition protein [Candidatus Binataceae bacterium]|nr:ParB/RepB/Spo0J family partition protein [Candidatus Binataceae bacterium]
MVRKPLGRGLDALIGDSAGAMSAAPGSHDPKAGTLTQVAVDRIKPGPYQPRVNFDPEKLEELRRAIEAQGVIEPLIVRRASTASGLDVHYELIAGERRLRAARAAGLATVPVVVRELDDNAALEMSIVENIMRENLNPVEEGLAFSRLCREASMSHEQVAVRIGKSRPYVSNAIRLLELPHPVLKMIASGDLTAGQARPLLGLATEEQRIAAANRIAHGQLNSRGAEEIVRTNRGKAPVPPHATIDPNLKAMVESLQRALKRKVRISQRRGKTPGRVSIEYYDDNDLTALAALLTGVGRNGADARV